MKKKQPTKVQVQLSKEDLVELLTVLKNFVLEELLSTSKKDNSRMDLIYESLFNLEADQKAGRSNIAKLARQLSCGARTGHHFSVVGEYTGSFLFRCTKCDLEYGKDALDLSRKEKKLIRLISKGGK